MADQTPSTTKCITPKAMLSYPHLFEPRAVDEGGEPKYSAAFVFAPGTDLTAMEKAAEVAGREKFGDKQFETLKKAGKLRMPFRSDTEERGYPDGSTYFNATSKTQPGMVQPFAGKDGRPAELTDEKDIYPGCFVRASVNFYGYDTKGNKGVAVGLNNLQKMAEGERLDFRKAAKDEFDAVDAAEMEDATSIL
jgi:hypothetical protein